MLRFSRYLPAILCSLIIVRLYLPSATAILFIAISKCARIVGQVRLAENNLPAQEFPCAWSDLVRRCRSIDTDDNGRFRFANLGRGYFKSSLMRPGSTHATGCRSASRLRAYLVFELTPQRNHFALLTSLTPCSDRSSRSTHTRPYRARQEELCRIGRASAKGDRFISGFLRSTPAVGHRVDGFEGMEKSRSRFQACRRA